MTEQQVHHATRKSADNDLARKNISPESHKAVHAGTLTLQEARELGRNAGPDGPAIRADKDDTSTSKTCLACGEFLSSGKRRFHQGCDMKMHRLATEYVRGQRELTDEQLAYVEESGKLDRARERVIAEEEKAAHAENRRREREAAKQKAE